jgi:hypothetical protein
MSTDTSQHLKMQNEDTNIDELMKSLTDSFNILADEVQSLSDRKTILEHKLRFAHEQVCTTIFTYFEFLSGSLLPLL